MHRFAQLAIIAVAEHTVDRVDTDKDAAVDQVATDAQPCQRTGLEAVGIGAAAAQRGVVAQVGAHQQVKPTHRAAHLEQLQAGQRDVARGVALDDQLYQRAGYVHPPGCGGAARADAVGTAVDAPQAAANGAAHLHCAERVACGHARQEHVGRHVTGHGQGLQASAFESA